MGEPHPAHSRRGFGLEALLKQFYFGHANHVEINFIQLTPLGNDVAFGWGDYHVTGQGQSGPLKVDGDWSATYGATEASGKFGC